jgi:hypothetical protein
MTQGWFSKARTVIAVLATVAATACGTSQPEERITAAEFGGDWPFTVVAINLRCGDPPRRHVIFEANGVLYALNGSARESSKRRDGVWRDSDEVRKVDPAKAAQRDVFDRPYTNLPQSFIDRGLRLCDAQR